MKLTKDQIITALPGMSQQDLLAIRAVTGHLLQPGATTVQNSPDNAQGWLFAALAGLLNTTGISTDHVKQFEKNAPAFLAFVSKHFSDVLNSKVRALSLMTSLLQMIAYDLKSRGIPVTANTVTQHMPRIAEIFEAGFPGYIDSGIAGMCAVSHR